MMKYTFNSVLTLAILLILFIYGCSRNSNESAFETIIMPEVYKKIYGAISIKNDGTYIVIKTNGLPDYKSVYYDTTSTMYEAFNGNTFEGNAFIKNPNNIISQNYTFKIPVKPAQAINHIATPLGPIGISINGVPFYNQYAGPGNKPLTTEVSSFDKYYGHPQQTGQYHYHVEPIYLTTIKTTKSALLGFMLDGFPIYGPKDENGVTVNNNLLDEYHGHIHSTIDYPKGIYHYHFTTEAPYLNGNGFYGTAGTAIQ